MPAIGTPTSKELATASVAGRSVLQHAIAALKQPSGAVDIETTATALGAFGGWACQSAALYGIRKKDPTYQGLSWVEITTADGHHLYSGDALNSPLAERAYSLWDLVAAATAPHSAVPDLGEIFRNAAASIGTPAFGRTRSEHPMSALRFQKVWPLSLKVVRKVTNQPRLWPIAYGAAVQEMFGTLPEDTDFSEIARVVLDSAVATSKVPLG